jgi:hypothetical protein
MVDPSNRKALRRGLPWTLLGFVVLVASIALWVAFALLTTPAVLHAARVLGLLGSALFGLGLSTFTRERRSGPGGRWLDVALILWLAELGLRAAQLVAPEHVGELAVGLRLGCIAGSMAALATWMTAVWSAAPRVRISWSATRVFFLLQIAAVGLLASVPGATSWLPQRFELASAWVLFGAPWIVLYVALRRTMRELGRQHSVSDVLTS